LGLEDDLACHPHACGVRKIRDCHGYQLVLMNTTAGLKIEAFYWIEIRHNGFSTAGVP